jgi:hypothetical protein
MGSGVCHDGTGLDTTSRDCEIPNLQYWACFCISVYLYILTTVYESSESILVGSSVQH